MRQTRRVYLRLQLEEPDPVRIAQAVSLFEAAAQAAARAGNGAQEPHPGDWPTTSSTAWQTDIPPEDSDDRKP